MMQIAIVTLQILISSQVLADDSKHVSVSAYIRAGSARIVLDFLITTLVDPRKGYRRAIAARHATSPATSFSATLSLLHDATHQRSSDHFFVSGSMLFHPSVMQAKIAVAGMACLARQASMTDQPLESTHWRPDSSKKLSAGQQSDALSCTFQKHGIATLAVNPISM